MFEIYEVVRVLDLTIAIGDTSEEFRLEISRRRPETGTYLARVLRREYFRLQPTFPQHDGVPSDEACDEELLVDESMIMRQYTADFEAASVDEAERLILQEIEAWVRHASGECGGESHAWGECGKGR